ncbi:type II secretion system GspH family protein [Candidatus Saccharibacteria bacterium]|nr:type II secretion system GspH family protein [Candidatus Saccharibacteria bacterium]
MKKSVGGFTIVELLIVIVVIAILAAITVVAYTGIQTQAKNTKTISAVTAWAKGIRLYEAEKGELPSISSCLGDMNTYDGNGRCWNSSTWTVNQSFLDAMGEYMGNFPSPDVSQIDSINYPDRRGAFYHVASGNVYYIWVMLLGTPTCPSIAGLTLSSSGGGTEGKYCRYTIL